MFFTLFMVISHPFELPPKDRVSGGLPRGRLAQHPLGLLQEHSQYAPGQLRIALHEVAQPLR
jgi:hypothetical protein